MIPVDMLGETIYQVVYWYGRVKKPAPGCDSCGHQKEQPTYEYLWKAEVLPKKVLYVGEDCIACDFSYEADDSDCSEAYFMETITSIEYPFTEERTTAYGFPIFHSRKHATEFTEKNEYRLCE